MRDDPYRIDPRVRRIQQMLFDALSELLTEKSFEEVSVQDLAERAMLNRATFYDHFTDKFDLAGKMIEDRFQARAHELWIPAEESCSERTRQLILMTCVFLSEYFTATQKIGGQFYSLVESRIRDVISELCAVGLRHKGAAEGEIGVVSTLASWCVCGVAFDWYRHRRISAERMVEMVLPFVIRVCKTA